MINELPDPVLTQVYRCKSVLGPAVDVGEVRGGHRWVAPLVGGTFTGPELSGSLLPGGSATWQVLSDGTAHAEARYTLRTDGGALLYVHLRGVGHGDPAKCPFHAATRIETAEPSLDWLNNGVLLTVVGCRAANLLYETYLVG